MTLTFSEFLEEMEKPEKVVSHRGDCPICGDPIIGQPKENDQFIRVDGKDILVCENHHLKEPRKLPEEMPFAFVTTRGIAI